MARSIQQLEERIIGATQPGFRRQLLARGLARNLIWSKGVLPPDSPQFSPTLSSDLLSYGMGILVLALELKRNDRHNTKAIEAFSRAAEAIEAVVRDGNPETFDRGFYTIIAAASYHLAHFSAKAFSLLPARIENFNLCPTEKALTLILARDFHNLRLFLRQRIGVDGPDKSLANELTQIKEQIGRELASERRANVLADDPIASDFAHRQLDLSLRAALESIYNQALASFEFSLESGNALGITECIKYLEEGVEASAEYGAVTMWWAFTITRHLIDDLWEHSLFKLLPTTPANNTPWDVARWLFISKLFRQNRSEIELWPSQIIAASRALDETDDLVVTLPTSAGKTRIAELCILRALSLDHRVVFVTPLRALSAQTERSLKQTFAPLGYTISSLYGSSGSVGDDVDSLRNRDVVIATPEKLDFALRNDPDLLNNVGLIVFDEAHTLGLGEREVRYEVLVQRLLRREDAQNRRIVCLSAILPQGEQLEDFVKWVRQDQDGESISVDWRPTRQRFGEIFWSGNRAELSYRVEGVSDDDAPFIRSFITKKPPLGTQTKDLPRDRNDLSLMCAWRFVDEGQTVLVYCNERRSVNTLAKLAIDLIRRGYLRPLLECDPAQISEAENIGREWLGENHAAVQCLRYGIAIHHARLPRPFLRAIEKLLKEQLLKVTISSPTLAQGLNLSATTVLFPKLLSNRKLLKGEEFANVAGRAGRAFVDVEGQVLCVAWERKHLVEWDSVLRSARVRNIKSGLLQLILDFSKDLADKKGYTQAQVLEFITANAGVWAAPKPARLLTKKQRDDQALFEQKWAANLACLDTAILSTVQHDVEAGDVAGAIDIALTSSLWERSILRENDTQANIAKLLLRNRSEYIWTNSTPLQRKGYFFAGISFDTGRYLDEHAEPLKIHLLNADTAFGANLPEQALESVISFATIIFSISPFKPRRELPGDWKEILKGWVSGRRMTDLAGDHDNEVLEFIEDSLVYKLVWAMEAVRVKQSASEVPLDEIVLELESEGRAALAIETGTTNYCAALLIQNGLSSRIAANIAITDCPATFRDIAGMRRWLNSRVVKAKQIDPNWPSHETSSLWHSFVGQSNNPVTRKWEIQRFTVGTEWFNTAPSVGTAVRLCYDPSAKVLRIFSITFLPLGILTNATWPTEPAGTFVANVANDGDSLDIIYSGPKDLF